MAPYCKDICHQVWPPKFNPGTHMVEKNLLSAKLSSDSHMCAMKQHKSHILPNK